MSDYRMIAMDTETTGFKHAGGDRIIEVGCVEMVNRQLTGKTFTFRCSPCLKPISESATKVHGITDNDVKNLPPFKHFITDLFSFIAGSDVLFFNGSFDEGFLNAELKRAGMVRVSDIATGGMLFQSSPTPSKFRSLVGKVIDAMPIAKRHFVGKKKYNLSVTCERLGIKTDDRELHGALIDAKLTALAYLAMTRVQLDLTHTSQDVQHIRRLTAAETKGLIVHMATPEELAAEAALVAKIKDGSIEPVKSMVRDGV